MDIIITAVIAVITLIIGFFVGQVSRKKVAEREIGLVFRASAARSEEFRHFGELVVQAFEAAVARSRKVLAEKIG